MTNNTSNNEGNRHVGNRHACSLRTMKNRKNIRLRNYDYSQSGYYFVTICTKNRVCYLGDIVNGEMHLNESGDIVDRCLKDLKYHFPNSDVDYYCIMPNHIHAIIIINTDVENAYAENTHACSLRRDKQLLPVIVGSFKSAVSKLIHRVDGNDVFKWQKSYYERIIRNEYELYEIRKYVQLNPTNWKSDENNLINIKEKK